MAYRFNLNETSYHGKGAIKEIAVEAKGRHFRKAFVCSDPDLIRFNVTKKVLDVLEEAGLDYEVYSDIKANPTIENVQHGVAAFKASGADYIIAIGGGSSMDTAKAIGIIIASSPTLSSRTSGPSRARHRHRTHACPSSRCPRRREPRQRSRSTTSSPMSRGRGSSCASTRMTCPSWRSSTPT